MYFHSYPKYFLTTESAGTLPVPSDLGNRETKQGATSVTPKNRLSDCPNMPHILFIL